jgi:hypothetical protein
LKGQHRNGFGHALPLIINNDGPALLFSKICIADTYYILGVKAGFQTLFFGHADA